MTLIEAKLRELGFEVAYNGVTIYDRKDGTLVFAWDFPTESGASFAVISSIDRARIEADYNEKVDMLGWEFFIQGLDSDFFPEARFFMTLADVETYLRKEQNG